MLNDLLKKNQTFFYILGRVFAICIFGPYLIYTGITMQNNALVVLGALLIIWVISKLYIQLEHADFYNDREHEKRSKLSKLYFIVRVFALCIVGPYLVYVGNKIKNIILLSLGVCIMIWDGSKIGIQLYYNDFSY
jgi:hypothetical protein